MTDYVKQIDAILEAVEMEIREIGTLPLLIRNQTDETRVKAARQGDLVRAKVSLITARNALLRDPHDQVNPDYD